MKGKLSEDIKVSKKTKKTLAQLKIDKNLKTFDDVITMLLKEAKL